MAYGGIQWDEVDDVVTVTLNLGIEYVALYWTSTVKVEACHSMSKHIQYIFERGISSLYHVQEVDSWILIVS